MTGRNKKLDRSFSAYWIYPIPKPRCSVYSRVVTAHHLGAYEAQTLYFIQHAAVPRVTKTVSVERAVHESRSGDNVSSAI